jgi:hypothetical protein
MTDRHHNDEYEDTGEVTTGRYSFDDLASALAAEAGLSLDEAERAVEDFMFWR